MIHAPHAPHALRPGAARVRARARVGAALGVTYPYLLGGVLAYLALTVVSRDIALMCAGALLVLYGSAMSKALQGQTQGQTQGQPVARGADGP